MAVSEVKNKLKWISVLAGLSILIVADIVIDSFLFSEVQKQNPTGTLASGPPDGRFVASFEAGSILKFPWEEKAFEVLRGSRKKDIIAKGRQPSLMDRFVFEDLGGQYQVFEENGKVMEVYFAGSYLKPKNIPDRKSFLKKNLNFFSDKASRVRKVSGQGNTEKEILEEKFQILSDSNQNLGQIQILLDENQNLVSMKVQRL